jgi:SAM-dependent methyltransferase
MASYPVTVTHRDFSKEEMPQGGGIKVFNDDAAAAINSARIDHLAALDLDIEGARVLDVGCGVGHFSRFYVERGCTVVGVDGRPGNIEEMRRRYPDIEAHVLDVEKDPLDALGQFDVVHCYGLLYHLESPIRGLRNMQSVCRRLLVLETIVCDNKQPLLILDDETKTVNQALDGLGSRPSPSFVTMALDRVGFRHVYAPAFPPDYPDFKFEWLDNLQWQRDGHNLRCVFVASREALGNDKLVPLMT